MELASPSTITDILEKRNASGCLLQWTHDYPTDRTAKVRYQEHVPNFRTFENGTPLVGVLSPALLNVLMEVLIGLTLSHHSTLSLSLWERKQSGQDTEDPEYDYDGLQSSGPPDLC